MPATSSCRTARRCAPPRPTRSASRPSASQLEARNLELKKEAESVAEKLDGQTFVLIRPAGESGQLYGSVSARDLADAATADGFTVERSQFVLNTPIKTLGLHSVVVQLHPEVEVKVTVNVARSPDEAERQARGENVTALPRRG